jgi:hypothetical protein
MDQTRTGSTIAKVRFEQRKTINVFNFLQDDTNSENLLNRSWKHLSTRDNKAKSRGSYQKIKEPITMEIRQQGCVKAAWAIKRIPERCDKNHNLECHLNSFR